MLKECSLKKAFVALLFVYGRKYRELFMRNRLI